VSKSKVVVIGWVGVGVGVGVGVWAGVVVGDGVKLPIGVAVGIGELETEGVEDGEVLAIGVCVGTFVPDGRGVCELLAVELGWGVKLEPAIGVSEPVPKGVGLADEDGEGEAAGALLEKYHNPPATATIATATISNSNQVKSFWAISKPSVKLSYVHVLGHSNSDYSVFSILELILALRKERGIGGDCGLVDYLCAFATFDGAELAVIVG
jgi:hypothetical protein